MKSNWFQHIFILFSFFTSYFVCFLNGINACDIGETSVIINSMCFRELPPPLSLQSRQFQIDITLNINNNHYHHLKSDKDDDDFDDDDDDDVRRVKKVMRSKLRGGDMVRTYYQHKLCRCCVQHSGGVIKQSELNLLRGMRVQKMESWVYQCGGLSLFGETWP